jgi:hypothetical protein
VRAVHARDAVLDAVSLTGYDVQYTPSGYQVR